MVTLFLETSGQSKTNSVARFRKLASATATKPGSGEDEKRCGCPGRLLGNVGTHDRPLDSGLFQACLVGLNTQPSVKLDYVFLATSPLNDKKIPIPTC